jgi:hypothetical protein
MIDKKHFMAKILLTRVAAISVLGNLLGVALTFIYLGVLMPRLLHGSQIEPLGSTVSSFPAGHSGKKSGYYASPNEVKAFIANLQIDD